MTARAVAAQVAAAMWERPVPLGLVVFGGETGREGFSIQLDAALLQIARRRAAGETPLPAEVDALLAEVAVAAGLIERAEDR